MALQVFAASQPVAPGREEHQAVAGALGDAVGDWVLRDTRVKKAEKVLNRMAALAKSKRESKHDAISQVGNFSCLVAETPSGVVMGTGVARTLSIVNEFTFHRGTTAACTGVSLLSSGVGQACG